MKVVHVSASDTKGGAARAAYRLHKGLNRAGIDSAMVVAEKYSDDEKVTVPARDLIGYYERRLHYRQLTARFWRYAPSRPPGLSPFSHLTARRNRGLIDELPDSDIINMHWIAYFVDLPTFLTQSQMPLVWTLHDMNAFTGGCHYALDCTRFMEQCGACPQLGSKSKQDASHKIWQAKRNLYQLMVDNRLHIVTPSNWLAGETRHSSVLREIPLSVIPNGLDTMLFKPYEKSVARDQLGISLGVKVILFSAESVVSRRKGLQHLLSALKGLEGHTRLLVVSLGAGEIKGDLPIPVFSLGHFTDEKQIAMAYSAADLFVLPSLQDNLPNTVLEAMACGTPVVAFNVGGIPDMVRPGITGQLVPPKDIGQLRETILALLDDETMRVEMGINCRQIAEKEYSLDVQATEYIKLYQSLIDNEASSR